MCRKSFCESKFQLFYCEEMWNVHTGWQTHWQSASITSSMTNNWCIMKGSHLSQCKCMISSAFAVYKLSSFKYENLKENALLSVANHNKSKMKISRTLSSVIRFSVLQISILSLNFFFSSLCSLEWQVTWHLLKIIEWQKKT